MTLQKQALLLGAHMSTAGGFDQAIVRGQSIGCTTIQIFTKNNRQWHAPAISSEQQKIFTSELARSHINPVVAHASYLINIAASDPEIEEKSRNALILELERCHQLGIPYLVLHPGSHGKSTPQQGLERLIKNLDAALAHTPSNTMILLENMAGQGSSLCASFEQLAHVLQHTTNAQRIGICFDTCHAFAAGYDFRTPESYKTMWHHFDQTIGLNNLKVIHLNDSKKELGSRVDRHAEIGEGLLGLEAFSLLMNDPRLSGIAKILETPKDTLEDYARNMHVLSSLIR